jgi:genome maintenance exonuclease 1
MTFVHNYEYRKIFPKLEHTTRNGVRFYPVGREFYPSSTTVTSFGKDNSAVEKWRKRKGEVEANRLSKLATDRGSNLHKIVELYTCNEDYKQAPEWEPPNVQLMFPVAKPELDRRLGTIYACETTMYSKLLKLAGTVDNIAEVDGELAVNDFKGTYEEKPEEWLEHHFIQMASYWAMWSENTGLAPKKLCVWMIGQDGTMRIHEKRNIMDYLEQLLECIKKFNEHYYGRQ